MKQLQKLTSRNFLAFLLLILPSLMASTACQTPPHAKVYPLRSQVNLDNPARGKNKVWFDFTDQTGADEEVGATLRAKAKADIEDMGYENVGFSEEADYSIAATLRYFDEAENEAKASEIAKGLSTSGGAIAGGVIGHEASGGSALGTTVGAVGGGFIANFVAEKLSMSKTYVMVIDLEIGSRREGGVEVKQKSVQGGRLSQDTGGTMDLGAGFGSAEGGSSTSDTSEEQSSSLTSDFFNQQQRLMGIANGTSVDLKKAADMLIPKIAKALASQLHHYGGA